MGWQAEVVCSVILRDRGGGRRGGPDLRLRWERYHGRELLLMNGVMACTPGLEKTQTCSALINASSGCSHVPSAPARAGRMGLWGEL